MPVVEEYAAINARLKELEAENTRVHGPVNGVDVPRPKGWVVPLKDIKPVVTEGTKTGSGGFVTPDGKPYNPMGC